MTRLGGPSRPKIQVLTCADSNFFHFLPNMEKITHKKIGHFPLIYDLGLTRSQKSHLKSPIVEIAKDFDMTGTASSGNIRATHKPSCILDFLDKTTSGCLYVDADTVFMEAIDWAIFAGIDVAVTPRHPREIAKLPDPYKNGQINAGVLYFANTAPAKHILRQWKARCETTQESDQMALSNILDQADLKGALGIAHIDGANILKLDPTIFNDIACRTGKIWHFKNAGRRQSKKVKLLFASAVTLWLPVVAKGILQRNRKQLASHPKET